MKKTNVLITGAGGPAAICAFKALANEKNIELFMADMSALASGLYLVPPERRMCIPRGNHEAFADNLLKKCIEKNISIVFSTVDDELLPLAKRKSEFQRNGIQLCIAEEQSLQTILNKHALLERLQRAGLEVGAFAKLTELDTTQFPDTSIVVKPQSGSGSRGVCFYDSLDEIPKHKFNDQELMVQEQFQGQEYSVDMFMFPSGRILACVPRIRMRTDSGVSVTGQVVNNLRVISYAKEVVKILGLPYAANVQIMDTAEGPRLIEINPRFSGGLSLVVQAGANTPKMALEAMMGKEVQPVYQFNEVGMVRYFTEHFTNELIALC
ncbi:MAG: ATP-grasp domain-containing protein [Saprospiraceae bacterium]|nr:ATP-grasp domain-containing protein [Saprospiraceae bacterium]